MIQFQKLTPNDAEAMREIEALCFTLPWPLAQCEKALSQEAFSAYGFWRDKRLLAYISFYHIAEELEIINLGVAPKFRRKGYGKRILAITLQIAHKMGMQKALLEVRESNAAAIALYKKSGFHRVGIRSCYYPDTGENALIFSRVI